MNLKLFSGKKRKVSITASFTIVPTLTDYKALTSTGNTVWAGDITAHVKKIQDWNTVLKPHMETIAANSL